MNVRVPKQRRRHERITRAPHVPDESDCGANRDRSRRQHRGIGPAAHPCLGESPGAGGQRHHRQHGASEVEAACGVRVSRLRYRHVRTDDGDRGDRNVDQERPPPSRSVDKSAAHERSDRASSAPQPRPALTSG